MYIEHLDDEGGIAFECEAVEVGGHCEDCDISTMVVQWTTPSDLTFAVCRDCLKLDTEYVRLVLEDGK